MNEELKKYCLVIITVDKSQLKGLDGAMRRLPLSVTLLTLSAPTFAISGHAPPATGWAARAIVMVIDPRGNLCTGTALTRDVVLTSAHCIARKERYKVRSCQTGKA